MLRRFMLLMATGLLLSACAAPDTPTPDLTVTPLPEGPIPTGADVVYGPDSSDGPLLDLYLPDDSTRPFPVVVLMHGGGGTKDNSMMQTVIELIVEQGYAAVSVAYRTDSTSGEPLPLQDGFCALAWIHSKAGDYNLDADRIAAFGHSIGAMHVSNLAVMEDAAPFMANCPHTLPDAAELKGAVTFGGAFAASEIGGSPQLAQAIAYSAGVGTDVVFEPLRILGDIPPAEWPSSEQLTDEQRAIAQLLPPYWVDAGDPPFLLLWGMEDRIVPLADSEAFAGLLEAVGVGVEVVQLPDADHESFASDDWQAPTISFLAGVFGE